MERYHDKSGYQNQIDATEEMRWGQGSTFVFLFVVLSGVKNDDSFLMGFNRDRQVMNHFIQYNVPSSIPQKENVMHFEMKETFRRRNVHSFFHVLALSPTHDGRIPTNLRSVPTDTFNTFNHVSFDGNKVRLRSGC